MDGKQKTMAVLGVLIVGMSALFVGGAFASPSSHANNPSTAPQEHHNATDPVGPQHAGQQDNVTDAGDSSTDGADHPAEAVGNASDPAGGPHAGHQDGATGAADNGTDVPDNPAEAAGGN